MMLRGKALGGAQARYRRMRLPRTQQRRGVGVGVSGSTPSQLRRLHKAPVCGVEEDSAEERESATGAVPTAHRLVAGGTLPTTWCRSHARLDGVVGGCLLADSGRTLRDGLDAACRHQRLE